MPSEDAVRDLIEVLLAVRPAAITALVGGCIAEVYRVELGGELAAVKVAATGPSLRIEAAMLGVLADAGVRVPRVIASSDELLVLEYIENDGRRAAEGEEQLASALARLHAVEHESFGLEFETLIGPLPQVNAPTSDWPAFYFEHRLVPLTERACASGGVTESCARRLFDARHRIAELIGPGGPAVLVHGDLWSGNVLWNNGDLAALIDPAVYRADAEVELAFIDLMGGMGPAFWSAYQEAAGIRPGFWEVRRRVYHLYPLLVHAALFGGGYGRSVEAAMREIGL
jgi:fructosamine-3-kinase